MNENWEEFFKKTPPYEDLINSILISTVIQAVMQYAEGGKVLEIGFGSGYTAIELARQGLEVTAIDRSEVLKGKAEEKAEEIEAKVNFIVDDAFVLRGGFISKHFRGKFDVVYHQGFLEHFSNEDIVKLLEKQVKIAKWVIVSVPSIHYGRVDIGTERLLTLPQWNELLKDYFKIEDISYYEDDKHILIIIKGGVNGGSPGQAGTARESSEDEEDGGAGEEDSSGD